MENTSQEAIKISRISILINLLLSAGTLAAGLLANSGAMISDAVHSASDVFSTLVVIVGVKLSGKDSDREHPYGHERMECVAAILLSGILLATGLVIGWEGIQQILSERAELRAPGILAAAAALVSILVKELLFRYVRGFARKLDSTALMAEAWHHRSDALSSIGALAGASMLVFSLLYTPCVAAVASIRRELGHKWAVSVVLWQCGIAWIAALIVRLIGLALGLG